MLGVIRRLLLRDHAREHAEVDRHLAQADRQLDDQEVRLRRLEVEARLAARRLRDEGAR